MRRILLVALAVALLAGFSPARSGGKPLRLVFLSNGGTIAKEVQAGIEAAASDYTGDVRLLRRAVETVVLDASLEADDLEKAIAAAKPVAVIAAPRAAELLDLQRLARRGKSPFLFASPWEPIFSLRPTDPVLHAGGNAVDQAVEAAGYCKVPFGAGAVAAIHDGSRPSKALAETFLRNRFEGTQDADGHIVPRDREEIEGLLQRLGGRKVEAVFVALDHEDALRVARAAADLDRRLAKAAPAGRREADESTTPKRPRLLFADGVLTGAMAEAAPETARFMVGSNPYLDGGPPASFREGRETREEMPSSAGERGYMAAALVLEGLANCRIRLRALLPAIRELGYEDRMGTTVLSEWGQTRFFTWNVWKATGTTAVRVRPTYLPDKAGGLLLRQKTTGSLRWEPDTRLIHLWWGKPRERTIEKDLARIGLITGGYESELDRMILDEILVRAAVRLNRMFWRNADGSAIPGVSYNITFVTEIPERFEKHHWGAKIAGDHPSAGGMAGDPYSSIFSTFLVRTMYLERALKPPIERADLDYFRYRYEWGSDVKRNLRNDHIRCLIDGFAGAIAMTTAHELGHVAGCGHDVVSPRSIMNVAEGAGLDPDWAEWIPLHVKALEGRLGRHEVPRERRRR